MNSQPVPPFTTGADWAAAMDECDSLAPFRRRFHLPPDTIYLDGNSLGLASHDAEEALREALQAWKERAIEGWSDGGRPWFFAAETLGEMAARLVGAAPDQVVVTGSTTVNLHTLAATFFRPQGRRTRIIAHELEFPSDIYALQSQLRLHGLDPEQHLIMVPSRDGRTISEDDLIAALSDETAMLISSIVLYRSGQLLDVARVAQACRERGVIAGWDGCHSVGSVPHTFDAWDIDFAYWCNYKYLNGGPAAPGALYVNRRHFGRRPGLAGWFGNHKQAQFDMRLEMDAHPSAGAWQISGPPIFSAAPLYGSLGIFLEAGLEHLRAKSLHQTAYLIFLTDQILAPLGYTVGTPREPARRGGHVAVEHPEGFRISQVLRNRRIIPDFRPPNIIRLGPVPLYNSYQDIWRAVAALRDIAAEKAYEAVPRERDFLT